MPCWRLKKRFFLQNEQLRESCSVLQQESEKFRALHSKVPAHVVQVDSEGNIVECNEFFYRSFKRAQPGNSLFFLVPDEDRLAFQKRFYDFFRKPALSPLKGNLIFSNGKVGEVIFRGSLLGKTSGEQNLLLCGQDTRGRMDVMKFLIKKSTESEQGELRSRRIFQRAVEGTMHKLERCRETLKHHRQQWSGKGFDSLMEELGEVEKLQRNWEKVGPNPEESFFLRSLIDRFREHIQVQEAKQGLRVTLSIDPSFAGARVLSPFQLWDQLLENALHCLEGAPGALVIAASHAPNRLGTHFSFRWSLDGKIKDLGHFRNRITYNLSDIVAGVEQCSGQCDYRWLDDRSFDLTLDLPLVATEAKTELAQDPSPALLSTHRMRREVRLMMNPRGDFYSLLSSALKSRGYRPVQGSGEDVICTIVDQGGARSPEGLEDLDPSHPILFIHSKSSDAPMEGMPQPSAWLKKPLQLKLLFHCVDGFWSASLEPEMRREACLKCPQPCRSSLVIPSGEGSD